MTHPRGGVAAATSGSISSPAGAAPAVQPQPGGGTPALAALRAMMAELQQQR